MRGRRTQEHQNEKCESDEALRVQQRMAGSRLAIESDGECTAESDNGQQCELRQEFIISACQGGRRCDVDEISPVNGQSCPLVGQLALVLAGVNPRSGYQIL
jgi:hypothetical protein